jgi:hypothetical protein
VTPPAAKAATEAKAAGTAAVKNYEPSESLNAPEGWRHQAVDENVTAWRHDRPDGLFVLISDAEPSAPSASPTAPPSGGPVYTAALIRPGNDVTPDRHLGFITGSDPFYLAKKVAGLPASWWPVVGSAVQGVSPEGSLEDARQRARQAYLRFRNGQRDDVSQEIAKIPGPEGLAFAAILAAEAQREWEVAPRGALLLHPVSDLCTALGRRATNGQAPWPWGESADQAAEFWAQGAKEQAWDMIESVQAKGQMHGAAMLVDTMREIETRLGRDGVLAFASYACQMAHYDASVQALAAEITPPPGTPGGHGSYGEALPTPEARRALLEFVRSDSEPVMPLRRAGQGYQYGSLQSAVEALRNNLTGVPLQAGTLELRDGRLVDFNNLRDPEGQVLRGQYAYRVQGQPWHAV